MKKHLAQRLFFLAVSFTGLLQTAHSQTMNHSWEVHAEASSSNTETLLGESGAGFSLGTTWKPAPSFGLVADLEFQPSSGRKDTSFTSVMGGPRFFSNERHRLSGFLQALGGGYRAKAAFGTRTDATWHYRWGGGGGVDIRITDNLALRLFEYDLTFIGADSGPLLCARGASGLVFRFGRQ